MDDFFLWSDLWLGEVVVEGFDGVGDEGGLGGGVDDLETAVVLEYGSDGEASASAIVPFLAGTRLGVDDDRAGGAMGVASKLKGPLKSS